MTPDQRQGLMMAVVLAVEFGAVLAFATRLRKNDKPKEKER